MSANLEIGNFTLSLITVPEGEKPPFYPALHVWIENGTGEGMSVKSSVFANLIEKFWLENF